MKKHFSILAVASAFTLFGGIVVACSDDSTSPVGSSSGNPLNQTDSGGSSGSSGSSGGGDSGSDAACSSPPGCFCGTPTTQVQFLNRCTSSVALPVNLTVKPATTADIP